MNLAQKFEQRGREEGRREGREEGRREGRKEGRKEAELETLRTHVPRMVQLRFGSLDQPTLDRIAAADIPTLWRWCDRVMDAPTLGDLLDG